MELSQVSIQNNSKEVVEVTWSRMLTDSLYLLGVPNPVISSYKIPMSAWFILYMSKYS